MMHNSKNPIGIFDSGMGGLTVTKTITDFLPNENIVYFGDTAHTPWGDKSTAAIQLYATRICDVLLQHHCKLIVIACHTASTAADECVREHIGNKAQVINVVDPIIEHLRIHYKNKKIGLIGTKQTVRSNIYKKRIDNLNSDMELTALATPLLVPLIEEGYANNEISKVVIKEYLSRFKSSDIQALILGCTHYPLMKPFIEDFFNHQIDIVDAGEITASAVKNYLTTQQLLNKTTDNPKRVFYVSDHNEFFSHTAKVFFPGTIQLEPYPLWE